MLGFGVPSATAHRSVTAPIYDSLILIDPHELNSYITLD